MTERNRRRGDFYVNTFFWDDFEAFLQHELDLLQKHYRDFVVRILPTGTVLSKMLSLHVGVGRPDTLYEVVIGKTLPLGGDENPSFGLAYYKDLAFLVNLQTRQVALFRVPLRHFAELESAIESRQDQRILSRWLSEIGGIDRVLELAGEDQTIAVSREQMRAMEAFDWRP